VLVQISKYRSKGNYFPYRSGRNYYYTLILLAIMFLITQGVSAATTSLHMQKIGADGKTVLSEKDLDYIWMEQNLPVQGDGIVHYYHQGPVFVDNADPAVEEVLRWNPEEDKNVREKDMGAVKGTSIRDLCELIGGMKPGDTLRLKASDGFSRTFAYENIYNYSSSQGPMVLTWYRADEGYVPNYTTGMRLVFLADTSTNPWGLHVFGNQDWHQSASPEHWYYYTQGNEQYPTTTGLSVQSISEITIFQVGHPSQPSATSHGTPGKAPGFGLPLVLAALGITLFFASGRRYYVS
jgi:hypothetical protein